jgi:hypothetical protein
MPMKQPLVRLPQRELNRGGTTYGWLEPGNGCYEEGGGVWNRGGAKSIDPCHSAMTSDIATSTSGVSPSDIELTGSTSPDPAPAWSLCLALDNEGENSLSHSRSQKSDLVKQTWRLGFSERRPGARAAW